MPNDHPTDAAKTEVGAAFAAVATYGRQIHERSIDGHSIAFVPNADGSYEIEDLAEYHERPPRLAQLVKLHTTADLVDYCSHFGQPARSIIFADRDRGCYTAVFDYHDGPIIAARLLHRAQVTLRHTPAWKAWTAKNGKPFEQADFAQFVEDHMTEIGQPSGAALLEMVRTFEAKKEITYSSAQRQGDGQVLFTYNEVVNGPPVGKVSMPTELKLVLKPFEGSIEYPVTARMRWRIPSGKLTLWYDLLRADDVLDAAFADETQRVKNGTVATVRALLHGTID
jgi:uncharacterized protein YfdQ (DUF2303 family)